MNDMTLLQNVPRECICMMKKERHYLDFYGGVAVNSPGNRNPRSSSGRKGSDG